MKPIEKLTKGDIQILKRPKGYGTNGQDISVDAVEVHEMRNHLIRLYGTPRIQMSFAERMVWRNKIY